MSRIYLDTCVVIYIVEKKLPFAAKVESLLQNIPTSELCFSPLVELECLVMPIRNKDSQLKHLFENFFASQTRLKMEAGIFLDAARLRADFLSLKTPDALHLATAMHHGCDEFWTNDNRLNSIAPNLVKNIL